MKNKRFFSFLAALLFLITLLGGCKTGESPEPVIPKEEQLPEATVPEQQWREIIIPIYPVDLHFTEFAEVTISNEPLDLNIGEKDLTGMQLGEDDNVDEFFNIRDNENVLEFMAFREEKMDMAKGVPFYRIQIQKHDDDGITIFTGVLFPDQGVEWDESELIVALDPSLKAMLSNALLGDLEWIPYTQAEMYAYNQNLTKCYLFEENVIYTSEDCSVFQIQTYDDEGVLYNVTELSQNSTNVLLGTMVKTIPWSEDIYPTMSLMVQEEPQNEADALQELTDTYEDQIADLLQRNEQSRRIVEILIWVLLFLVLSNVISLVCLFLRKKRRSKKKREREKKEDHTEMSGKVKSFGAVHNIGSRSGQQDSFDVINCNAGTLAVVADGMGGLTDGDKVSQKIVATMRGDSLRLRPGQTDKVLCQMVAHANQEVNRMLGTARQYKCGSTLLAVLIENNIMQWISVGDSRIYLYRGGALIQINREHIYCTELLERAINGKISFGEALCDPQANRLSSFIGMGELKHVDICLNRLELCAGDRVLLMSDGVFNTLSNKEIADVIQSSADTASAAAQLEQKILQKNSPNQDNFTCVILEM